MMEYSEEEDIQSELDEDRDADLEEELAALENFEIPDLNEIPIVFNPPTIYLKTIESLSKDLFQTEQLLSKKIDSLTDVAVKIIENDPEAKIANIEDSVKEIIDQLVIIKTYKHNLETSKETMVSLGGQVKEVNHPEEVMPSSWLGIGEASGGEGSDEEVIISRQVEVLKCPITCAWYENPVTSSVCKHSFSKDAIMSLLRKSRGNIACPVAGCSSEIIKDYLEPNPNLVRRLERVKSQQTREKSQGRNDETANVIHII